MSSVPLNTKRQYKVLKREQQRMKDGGQPEDNALNEKILNLLKEYPALDEVETKISNATATTLAMGEFMSKETIETAPPASSTVKPAVSSGEPDKLPEETAETMQESRKDVDSAIRKEACEPERKFSIARLLWFATFVMRLQNDLNAKPTTSKGMALFIIFSSIITAGAHGLLFTDLCTPRAVIVSPYTATMVIHFSIALSSLRESSPRHIIERFVVYTIREVIPSVLISLVCYSAALPLFLAINDEPPLLFCPSQ